MKKIMMLPFLDQEDLLELALSIDQSSNEDNKGLNIHMVLPFLNEDSLDKVFLDRVEKNLSINSLLPFLSKDTLDKITEEILTGKSVTDIHMVLPFLHKEKRNELFMEFYERRETDRRYLSFLPFISSSILSELVDQYIEGDESVPVDELYPFMKKQDIKRLYNFVLKKKSE